jgi:hypothetical protein
MPGYSFRTRVQIHFWVQVSHPGTDSLLGTDFASEDVDAMFRALRKLQQQQHISNAFDFLPNVVFQFLVSNRCIL